MEISKNYIPAESESKWYDSWMKNGYFRSVPNDKEPFTIVIPPPNVTGVLHMGHMLNNTLQDVLIRRARMRGYNACWVPGTDHASIATEARVVKMLAERGIKKSEIGREEFLKYAWEWKEKYGGIILDQLKKLGASCDWERTRFTMDEPYYKDVINVFIDLYEKGFIYRGKRMVNWDPVAKTAVSDEEVHFVPTQSKLLFVKYLLEDGSGHLTVATVRPETIMGDVAVAVHPNDERYKHLHGKKVIVPLVNRTIPIITDEAIDLEFGTGCLKVTPAHDQVDYEIGLRHNLPVIDVLNADGTISEAAGIYVGMDRFVARKKSIVDLTEANLIEKTEDYSNNVGHSERTNAPIEPRLSLQWYLKMKEISQPALDAVVSGEINLIPSKFINTYKHWMENVRDWCLSRQLWWGHRIPAWYDEKGNYVVAASETDAINKYEKKFGQKVSQLKQDEDVLDTWASSWLWPISVFNGFENPEGEIKYYYPTNDLVTAPEILFFWVARMIIAGKEYKKEIPFKNVYLTGIVRDKLGRKMSKSLGNSPEPLDLIKKYGADGVRVGMLLCSPAGNDLPFDEGYCEQGRNFWNKLWNAFRLINGWSVAEVKQPDTSSAAIQWFENKLNEQIANIDDLFSKYRISEALMATYKLVWDDFCSWYLEAVKPDYVDGAATPVDSITFDRTKNFLESLLKLLHPFMPFVTEEIWHLLKSRSNSDFLIISSWPKQEKYSNQIVSDFDKAKEIVSQVRMIRQQKNISPKEKLSLHCVQIKGEPEDLFYPVIMKLANLTEIKNVTEKVSNASGFITAEAEYFIPLGDKIDLSVERDRITKEIDYQNGFLRSVTAKLSNEKFVANAKPEVVDNERKKQSDALSKIKALEEQLNALKE
jgi:valyl-tRNA synthetase